MCSWVHRLSCQQNSSTLSSTSHCCSLVSSSALMLSPQPCTWQIDGINMKSGNVTFCMLYWFTVWMKAVIIQLYHWWSLLMPAQLIRSNALLSASSNVVCVSFVPQTILSSSISIWSLAAFNMKGEHLRNLVTCDDLQGAVPNCNNSHFVSNCPWHGEQLIVLMLPC